MSVESETTMMTSSGSPARPSRTRAWPHPAGDRLVRSRHGAGPRPLSALRRSWNGIKTAVLPAARAVPVGPGDLPTSHRIVGELTAEAGLPMPLLYVTPDAQPNPFARGAAPGTPRSR